MITGAFPSLSDLAVELLAEGWDNTVYVVGGTWVFRFPRRRIAVPGFQREIALLPQLAQRLPVPIPVPVHVAVDDDSADPWPFSGARLLPGSELAQTGLPEELRGPAAVAAGAFLRQLHAPATRDAVDAELPLDPMERAWPRARLEDTREQLRWLVSNRLWAGSVAVERLLDQAGALDRPAGEPVLVHGDLHVRHLLLDDVGHAAGVIDWGDVCWADPAVDLAFAYAAFTGAARASFFHAYGAVPADRELRARALGIRLSALLARYAATTERPTLLREALAGLGRAVT